MTNAYDEELTRTVPVSLSKVHDSCATITFANRALIAGGYCSKPAGLINAVESYNEDLTLEALSPLGTARQNLACAVVGNQVLFVGGKNSYTTTYNAVDVYTAE